MKRVAVVLLTLLLTCGCARSGPQADQRSCADVSTERAFPYYSLQDWVTYGDHLIAAQVRLTDEDGRVELVPTGTLWSRPLAPAAPGPLGRWARRAGPEGIELKAGHTYLTLLFRWNPSGQAVEWGSMDVLAFDDGIVGQGPDQCWPAGSLPHASNSGASMKRVYAKTWLPLHLIRSRPRTPTSLPTSATSA